MRGSIVCTASLTAESGTEFATDYTMSKHAVLGLVRSASKQLAARGVRVNCVSPGSVLTPLLCDMLKVGMEDLGKMIAPLYARSGNEMLTEKHVADAVVFLASEEAEFVTGHNLVVAGGVNPL